MVNIEKLDEEVRFCRDNPEKHNQAFWTCGTGACLAGNVALRNGYRVMSENYPFINTLGMFVVPQDLPPEAEADINVPTRFVKHLAMEILDIGLDDAEILFDGTNTIDILELMAKDLANGEHLDDRWNENRDGVYVREEKVVEHE